MNIEEEVVVERERERRRIGGKEQLCQNDRMNYRRNCSIMENDCGFKTIYSIQRVEIGKGAVSSCAMTSCQISFYICERCYSLLEHTKLILRFYCCSSSVGHFKVFLYFCSSNTFHLPWHTSCDWWIFKLTRWSKKNSIKISVGLYFWNFKLLVISEGMFDENIKHGNIQFINNLRIY